MTSSSHGIVHSPKKKGTLHTKGGYNANNSLIHTIIKKIL